MHRKIKFGVGDMELSAREMKLKLNEMQPGACELYYSYREK